MVMIMMAGRPVDAIDIADNLTNASFAVAANSVANVWSAILSQQVNQSNVIAFKARREYRYAMTMVLQDAVPAAMPDATEIRIVIYHPDGDQQKATLWKGTYGTIRQSSKFNVEQMIHTVKNADIQPGEFIRVEVLHPTVVCVIANSTVDLGVTRWVPK